MPRMQCNMFDRKHSSGWKTCLLLLTSTKNWRHLVYEFDKYCISVTQKKKIYIFWHPCVTSGAESPLKLHLQMKLHNGNTVFFVFNNLAWGAVLSIRKMHMYCCRFFLIAILQSDSYRAIVKVKYCTFGGRHGANLEKLIIFFKK
jgi:hypothetical protein